jgi:hypothetical protein
MWTEGDFPRFMHLWYAGLFVKLYWTDGAVTGCQAVELGSDPKWHEEVMSIAVILLKEHASLSVSFQRLTRAREFAHHLREFQLPAEALAGTAPSQPNLSFSFDDEFRRKLFERLDRSYGELLALTSIQIRTIRGKIRAFHRMTQHPLVYRHSEEGIELPDHRFLGPRNVDVYHRLRASDWTNAASTSLLSTEDLER